MSERPTPEPFRLHGEKGKDLVHNKYVNTIR